MLALQRTSLYSQSFQSVLFRFVFGIISPRLLQFRPDVGQELFSIEIQFVQGFFLLFKRLDIALRPCEFGS